MSARDEHLHSPLREFREERTQRRFFVSGQNREARNRITFAAVEGGGIRHTPPRPLRSLRCSMSVYSFNP
jgi:hypothetical protein